MNAIGETAIAISDSLVLSLVLKATLITALALISARMARKNCASVRHLLLITVFIVLLALPFGASLVPSIPIAVASVQPTAASMPRAQVPDAVAANTVNAAAAESQTVNRQRSVPVSTLMLSLWAAGVIVVLLPIIAGFGNFVVFAGLAFAGSTVRPLYESLQTEWESTERSMSYYTMMSRVR